MIQVTLTDRSTRIFEGLVYIVLHPAVVAIFRTTPTGRAIDAEFKMDEVRCVSMKGPGMTWVLYKHGREWKKKK